MLKHSVTGGRELRPWPRPVLRETLENQLGLSTRRERIRKRHLLLASLVGIVMTAFDPYAYADLFVSSLNNHEVLRYNEVTGAFIDHFVAAGSSGLSGPKGLLLGPDGNLYVS